MNKVIAGVVLPSLSFVVSHYSLVQAGSVVEASDYSDTVVSEGIPDTFEALQKTPKVDLKKREVNGNDMLPLSTISSPTSIVRKLSCNSEQRLEDTLSDGWTGQPLSFTEHPKTGDRVLRSIGIDYNGHHTLPSDFNSSSSKSSRIDVSLTLDDDSKSIPALTYDNIFKIFFTTNINVLKLFLEQIYGCEIETITLADPSINTLRKKGGVIFDIACNVTLKGKTKPYFFIVEMQRAKQSAYEQRAFYGTSMAFLKKFTDNLNSIQVAQEAETREGNSTSSGSLSWQQSSDTYRNEYSMVLPTEPKRNPSTYGRLNQNKMFKECSPVIKHLSILNHTLKKDMGWKLIKSYHTVDWSDSNNPIESIDDELSPEFTFIQLPKYVQQRDSINAYKSEILDLLSLEFFNNTKTEDTYLLKPLYRLPKIENYIIRQTIQGIINDMGSTKLNLKSNACLIQENRSLKMRLEQRNETNKQQANLIAELLSQKEQLTTKLKEKNETQQDEYKTQIYNQSQTNVDLTQVIVPVFQELLKLTQTVNALSNKIDAMQQFYQSNNSPSQDTDTRMSGMSFIQSQISQSPSQLPQSSINGSPNYLFSQKLLALPM